MPSYQNKNKTKNKWYCSFYYVNYQGVRSRKKKEGFATKREAEAWERDFLNSVKSSPEMPFRTLFTNYINDAENRLKRSTIANKLIIANTHILPFFGDMAIKDITPIVVREWQNGLLKAVSAMTGRKYTQTYLRTVNAELSACFNYAVKFYNLQENPVVKAGNIGATSAREMNIWTLEEFNLFNKDNITDPQKHLMFNLLFWGGMRMGEAMALTWEDIDFKNQKININKTYQRMGTEDVVTTPKTPKSTRILTMNESIIKKVYL